MGLLDEIDLRSKENVHIEMYPKESRWLVAGSDFDTLMKLARLAERAARELVDFESGILPEIRSLLHPVPPTPPAPCSHVRQKYHNGQNVNECCDCGALVKCNPPAPAPEGPHKWVVGTQRWGKWSIECPRPGPAIDGFATIQHAEEACAVLNAAARKGES